MGYGNTHQLAKVLLRIIQGKEGGYGWYHGMAKHGKPLIELRVGIAAGSDQYMPRVQLYAMLRCKGEPVRVGLHADLTGADLYGDAVALCRSKKAVNDSL